MVSAFGLRTLQVWLVLLVLIAAARISGRAGIAPALQQLTQISCDEHRAGLWDRQQQLTVPLATAEQCVLAAAWSPDGKQIAFVQHRMLANTGGMFPPDLVVSPSDAAGGQVVHDGGAFFQERERFYETRILWSPNGEWLLYIVRPGANNLRMWVVRADGALLYDYSRYIRFEPAVFFWAADSQAIYLRMVEFDAAAQRTHLIKLPLTPEPAASELPSAPVAAAVWVYPTTRGGEMLAFAADSLWLVNLDSGTAQILTDTRVWDYIGNVNLRWSADGAWLVLLGATVDKRTLLQWVRRSGTELHEFTMAVDAAYQQWFINDVYFPDSIRLVSPDAGGYICELELASEQMACRVGRETRRFIARPAQ
jgi:dipeptidyl aminopeptidase/acylaminoacyl peptidase